MPFFARRTKLPVSWGSVLPWIVVIALTSYRSWVSWREWKSSVPRGNLLVVSYLNERPSTAEIMEWTELYAVEDRNGTKTEIGDVTPRAWPSYYEHIHRTSSAGRATETIQGEAQNVTFHMLKEFPPSCEPRSDWHSFRFTNCNLFHEFDLKAGLAVAARSQDDATGEVAVKYGFAGASRESWLLDSSICSNGERHDCSSTTILRTLRWREVLDELIVEKQRIDALVSERLTSSPSVIDIYGFCGTSALNEYADGGMFASAFRHEYSDGVAPYTDRELLVFARDAAIGLAAIHDIDGRGNVTSVVHHDLRAENFLLSNGTLKISDFNNGQLLRWDFKEDKRCYGFDWSAGCGKSMEKTNRKAPEECLGEENRTLTTEGVEVFRFGAFLYYLLSKGNWTYSYEPISDGTLGRPKPEKVKKMILTGKRPSLPPFVKESNSTDLKAIVRAMRMAHTYDARKRPSARDIAEYLVKATKKGANDYRYRR